MKRRKENHPTSAPSAGTRKIIEFTTVPNPKEAIIHDRPVWDWGGIKQLLDQFLSLTTIRSIKSPNTEIERLAQNLYPLLPDAKGELKTLIRGAKRYHAMAQIGEPGQRAALAPYREPLRALAKAVRQKLSVVLCRPNLRDWDLRAFRLFMEMQQNLGRFPRLHFVTITIRGAVNYHLFREQFKKKKRQLNDRGFGVLPVFSIHPKGRQPGRLHAHVLVWSLRKRSAKQEKADLANIKTSLESPQGTFGSVKWETVTKRESMIREFAYMAKNYSDSLRAPKGVGEQIPKKSRLISRPKQTREGVCWVAVGTISLVTPARTSWRKAISLYAAETGRSMEGDRRWIWRERRRIRRWIEPETWWAASVTGLDGYTYRVSPAGVDQLGNEIYALSSDERGTFFLTEHGLEGLAKLQVMAGCFDKKERLDLTTGVTAYCLQVLGMYAFTKPWKTRRKRCA
jgi:hypothetical protein